MVEIYSPGQAKVLFDVWPEEAEWFVIGGPANGNEAQTIHQQYPHIKCVGFEPQDEMFKQQTELGFPGDLLSYALWNEECEKTIRIPGTKYNSSSMGRLDDWKEGEYSTQKVEARTLDSLENFFGPWNNIVLWLDIECVELEALQGCKRLLEDGKILLVNVEVFYKRFQEPIISLLEGCGFKEVKRWNEGGMPEMCEIIFRKETK